MKKYKIMAFSVFFVVILSIVIFHTTMNVIEIVQPPSEMWGRHINAGTTEFRKAPSVFEESGNLVIIYADKTGFRKLAIDNTGTVVETGYITIENYKPDKLVKYQSIGKELFWTENYDLYFADTTIQNAPKKKLLEEVLDYHIVKTENGIFIAAASKDTLSLYSFADGAITKTAEDVEMKDIFYITAAKDKGNELYIAAASINSPVELGLRLFSYESTAGKLAERIDPVSIDNMSTTREGSNSMNNLQIAFDDKDIYVFYEIGKSSSQGMVARTYMGRLAKNEGEKDVISFERLKLNNEDDNTETYISSLKCVEEVSDKVKAVIITPVRTSIKREGSEIMYIEIDDGSVVYKSLASNTGQWNRFASINSIGDEYMAVFLQTMGGTNYKVNVTSTGVEYKNAMNKTNLRDIKLGAMDTVGGYVFSFFTIFINLLMTAPILLWPIAVDFFEWKLFFYNPLITLNIGAAMETLCMYAAIKRIYANTTSVAYMPMILSQPWSPFAVLLITTLLSYIFIRLYRKGKPDLNSFPELALFIFVHNIMVYFLYTAYIARF